jgi:hypothetical protein
MRILFTFGGEYSNIKMKNTNTTLSIKNTNMLINQFLGNKIGVI